MAETFSSKVRAFLVAILIGLLVIAFAVWGVNDVFSQRAGTAVMKVGDSEVSASSFSRAFRQQLATLAQDEGRTLPHEEAYQRGIHTQVLSQLLGTKIIEVDADELGIGVNARTARDFLAEFEAFKDDLTGEYSRDQVISVLSRQSPAISLEEFEDDIISSLRQQQTLPAITGGVTAPLQFAEQRYKFITEQRKAKVLTLSDKAVPPAPEPTDEELQTYMDANAVRFTAPEYRRVTIIRLEPYDFALMNEASMAGVQSEDNLRTAFNNVFISDDEVKAQFDYKVELGELGSPAKRSLVQITANSEDNAKDVAEKLEEGLSASETATLFGLIEPITYDDVVEDAILDPETAAAAFDMKDGEVRTMLGGFGNWVTIQVTQATDEVKPDIESIRGDIVADILSAKAKDKIYDIFGALQDEIDEGRTLEEAAEIADVPFSTISFVDRSGTTPEGVKLAGLPNRKGIAQDEEILTNIFTADVGFETDYFDTSTGGIAMLRVDDIIESTRKSFDDTKDQAARLWKAEKLEESLNDLMLELAGKAQTGETLESIQAGFENGASLEEIMLVRANPGQKLGPKLAFDILEGSVGDVKRGEGPTRMTRQIAVLEEIISNQDSLGGQYADYLQDQVTAEIINDLQLAYRQAVLVDHPLQENQDGVKQVLGLDLTSE